ncbi:DUF4292 domain-containing protein [Ferruginibacter sp. SUN002]|uniref:DUF4292 domain-containing protein n=1 Tax=Ferruginibacter sp. SUN002 TaxID=2937789 RepID=UPI003D362A34
MRNILLVTTVIMAGIFFTSCRSAKKIQTAINKKDSSTVVITNPVVNDSALFVKQTMDTLKSKYIDYKTFAAKVKVEYEDSKGKQPNVTAYVHIIKDSVVWVSMYATIFNIEAFRVLITKDSVFLVDKINKEVQLRSLDYLQEITAIPFDFTTLQDLLVGNPIFMSDSLVSYRKTDDRLLLASVGQYFKHLLTLDTNNVVLHSKLDDVDITRNRTADITYDEYENKEGVNFSTFREITVSEKNKLDIQLKYKQYEFNKDLSVSFNIPKNYKRK